MPPLLIPIGAVDCACNTTFSIVYVLEPGSDKNLLTISIKPPQGYAVSLPLDPKTDLVDFQIGTRAMIQYYGVTQQQQVI